METPVCDFVRQYAQKNMLRFHMPGHKGMGPLGIEALDLTEIEGADVLYHSEGILKSSQDAAAALFGAGRSLYSTEGSSLSIRAMLYLAMLYGKFCGKAPVIAAGRNAHKTFMTAAALLDLEVLWLYPQAQETLLSCEITAENLEQTLAGMKELPIAVYLTSPDYLGNMADIRRLSQVCHRYGVLLLVDNAHGAYLRFLPQSLHPMDLGADLCCDSAHKTLPVLTGGGYLHISKNAPELFFEQAEQAMALFASTSPSYLILQSLDGANPYLADSYPAKLEEALPQIAALKKRIPFPQVGTEPLKLTLAPKSRGYLGTELAALLWERGIACEFSDPDFVVMMLTPELEEQQWAQLEETLCSIPSRKEILTMPPVLPKPQSRLSLRQAMFSPSRKLDIHNCLGRVLASANVSCPPAIPILVCGEQIDEAAIACFAYYGITDCSVVDCPL